MDGYGLASQDSRNSIYLAETPNLDRLSDTCPKTFLSASGLDVGLPDGQIGNSEVGHTNIGAGRVVFQLLPRITQSIENGSFFENKEYLTAIRKAKDGGHSLHILGLCSDGGVHSHITHIFTLLELAKREGLSQVYLHCFLDGRDVPPKSGAEYIRQLHDFCEKNGVGRIASIQGRFYGMDRDKRWERLQIGYDAIVHGAGSLNEDPVDAVLSSYEQDVTDEFIEPVICDESGNVKDGDSVVFINFRPDRAREMTWALTGNLPSDCPMLTEDLDLTFVCTAQYDEMLSLPIAFPPEDIKNTLGEYLSTLGLTQLRIAETEKYAHVTFFFNGGVEQVFSGEDRILIPSPKEFPTYDLIPEMSAYSVADGCVNAIQSGKYDVIVCNLANCDMVGHTGVLDAAVKAVETVDACVGKICSAVQAAGGILMITADHGNADCMISEDGQPHTAHTTNPVPLIVVGADIQLMPGRLCDLAPTLLDLMGYQKPAEMNGKSLIMNRKTIEEISL